MNICIFSDIHGNGPAFRAAYPMILRENADINIFLGDLCGYYFDQTEIFSLLQTIPNLIAVRGNHDSILLRIVRGDSDLKKTYHEQYGTSIDRLLEALPDELLEWLANLPESYFIDELGINLCHGSPWDILNGYVYPDSSLDKFVEYKGSFFLLGHTHYPMVKIIDEKIIVNPGSLGQPRNGGWPTYAVLDSCRKSVTFREIPYDSAYLSHQLEKLGNHHPYLKAILFR